MKSTVSLSAPYIVGSQHHKLGYSQSSAKSFSSLQEQAEFRANGRSRKFIEMSAWWTTGCLFGASSVFFGAFGAHGLKNRVTDPAKIASWQTAAHYQLVHSVALLVAEQAAPKSVVAKSLLTAGMTMFSGSIYLLVLDGQTYKPLGPVTPIGGLCLIGGWVALAFASRGRVRL